MLPNQYQEIIFKVVEKIKKNYLVRFRQYYLDWEDIGQQLYLYALDFFSRPERVKTDDTERLNTLLYRYLRWRIRRYILKEIQYRFTEIPNSDIGGYFDATSQTDTMLLDGLSDIQKTIAVLKYHYGYSTKEIAKIVCCSPRQVERILAEIRQSFQTSS